MGFQTQNLFKLLETGNEETGSGQSIFTHGIATDI